MSTCTNRESEMKFLSLKVLSCHPEFSPKIQLVFRFSQGFFFSLFFSIYLCSLFTARLQHKGSACNQFSSSNIHLTFTTNVLTSPCVSFIFLHPQAGPVCLPCDAWAMWGPNTQGERHKSATFLRFVQKTGDQEIWHF